MTNSLFSFFLLVRFLRGVAEVGLAVGAAVLAGVEDEEVPAVVVVLCAAVEVEEIAVNDECWSICGDAVDWRCCAMGGGVIVSLYVLLVSNVCCKVEGGSI